VGKPEAHYYDAIFILGSAQIGANQKEKGYELLNKVLQDV
jgi:hypothetical protein